METSEEIRRQFKRFADAQLRKHEPIAHKSKPKGSIDRLQSYFKELPNQMEKFNQALTKEANDLLNKAKEDPNIDFEQLKRDIFQDGKKYVGNFISTYKPK